MRKTALLAVVTVFGALGLLIPATSSASAAIPHNFTRHEQVHWTWYGPGSWTAAEGANDLWIGSATGKQYLHYGAGGAPCAYPGLWDANPTSYFNFVRAGYLGAAHQNFDLYSFGLNKARYTKVRPIQTVGPNWFRQTSLFQGKRNGKLIKGEMVLDFFYAGSGACGQRQQVRSTPSNGFANSINTLRTAQTLIFGPR